MSTVSSLTIQNNSFDIIDLKAQEHIKNSDIHITEADRVKWDSGTGSGKNIAISNTNPGTAGIDVWIDPDGEENNGFSTLPINALNINVNLDANNEIIIDNTEPTSISILTKILKNNINYYILPNVEGWDSNSYYWGQFNNKPAYYSFYRTPSLTAGTEINWTMPEGKSYCLIDSTKSFKYYENGNCPANYSGESDYGMSWYSNNKLNYSTGTTIGTTYANICVVWTKD